MFGPDSLSQISNDSKKQFDKALYYQKESIQFILLLIVFVISGLFLALSYYKVINETNQIDATLATFGIAAAIGLVIEIYFRKKYPKNSFPLIKLPW